MEFSNFLSRGSLSEPNFTSAHGIIGGGFAGAMIALIDDNPVMGAIAGSALYAHGVLGGPWLMIPVAVLLGMLLTPLSMAILSLTAFLVTVLYEFV